MFPEYTNETIDILGGMSLEKWNSDKVARDDRLKELVRAEYQPDEDGFKFGENHGYVGTHTLTADNYIKIVKEDPKLAKHLSVRNPSAVLDLAGMGYAVRDTVIGNDSTVIANAGDILDKTILDKLISQEIKRIRVVGTGGVVSIESGTMLIVPLIFLALLAALKLIMFDPLIKIMDERAEEINSGMEQAKLNRVEVAKLATESKDQFDHLRREHILELSKLKHEIILESESVIHEANTEALKIREEAHKELQETLDKVEKELRGKVDELAQDIVAQVIKGGRV